MKRRFLTGTAALLLAAAMLTGCGDDSSAKQAEQSKAAAGQSSAEVSEVTKQTDASAAGNSAQNDRYQEGYDAGYAAAKAENSAAAPESSTASENSTASHDYEEGYAAGYADGANGNDAQMNEDGIFDQGYAKGYEVGFREGKEMGAKTGTPSKLINVRVWGSFTATVRALTEDYCTMPGNTCAVVTLFQDMPFVLYLNEDLCKKLTVGNSYAFVIDTETELTADLLQDDHSVSSDVCRLNLVRASDVRVPKDDEGGLNCWNVNYTIK